MVGPALYFFLNICQRRSLTKSLVVQPGRARLICSPYLFFRSLSLTKKWKWLQVWTRVLDVGRRSSLGIGRLGLVCFESHGQDAPHRGSSLGCGTPFQPWDWSARPHWICVGIFSVKLTLRVFNADGRRLPATDVGAGRRFAAAQAQLEQLQSAGQQPRRGLCGRTQPHRKQSGIHPGGNPLSDFRVFFFVCLFFSVALLVLTALNAKDVR